MKHAALLKKKLSEKKILIAAHQGFGGGNIILNSPNAMRNAINMGADIVELDVSRSKDGEFFIFHQDLEPRHLCVDKKIDQMYAREIKELYLWNSAHIESEFRVATMDEMMEILRSTDVLINVDKCDLLETDLLDKLKTLNMEEQLLIKGKSDQAFLDMVSRHDSDFMFVPLVLSEADVDRAMSYAGLNIVGFEIIFTDLKQSHISENFLNALKSEGYFLWVNAITLGKGYCLSAGIGDDLAMLDHPDKGWGKLIDMGFNVLQTDWTPMLDRYLRENFPGGRSGGAGRSRNQVEAKDRKTRESGE